MSRKPRASEAVVLLPAPAKWDELSPREQLIVRMQAHGLSVPQISNRLRRSDATIERTALNARRKLGLPRVTAVVRFAVSIGQVWSP